MQVSLAFLALTVSHIDNFYYFNSEIQKLLFKPSEPFIFRAQYLLRKKIQLRLGLHFYANCMEGSLQCYCHLYMVKAGEVAECIGVHSVSF